MNHPISIQALTKIGLLAGQMATLALDRVIPARFFREKGAAFIGLAGLMLLAWCNWGNFHVHTWEQFHFYLGAKYQQEVGWFDLYEAAVLADAETTHRIHTNRIRDNRTFNLVPISVAFNDRERIVGRQFTPERWEEFKRDWVLLMQQPINPDAVVQDHGNSNSPAWALIAHPLAQWVPFTHDGEVFLGILDMLLMAVMWTLIWRTFDWKVASIALFMWATPPNVFDYLGGSFLRWDWLFCLGLTIVCMKKERWATAGAFFGFAVASKLFPIWFGVALGMRAAINMWRDKKLHDKYRRFAIGTVASGAAAVLLSSAMFGGFWVWRDYKARIDTAVTEKFYSIQYSLRTVYLQIEESSPAELANYLVFPNEMKQQRNDVDIADHQLGFKLVQILFTLMVLVLVLRADEIGAFCLGPMLVFTWLVVNMYYWNMFGLMALGLARRADQKPAFGALIGLNAIFALFYMYRETGHGAAEGYIVALQLCAWLIAFTYYEHRVLKAQMVDLVHRRLGQQRDRAEAVRHTDGSLGDAVPVDRPVHVLQLDPLVPDVPIRKADHQKRHRRRLEDASTDRARLGERLPSRQRCAQRLVEVLGRPQRVVGQQVRAAVRVEPGLHGEAVVQQNLPVRHRSAEGGAPGDRVVADVGAADRVRRGPLNLEPRIVGREPRIHVLDVRVAADAADDRAIPGASVVVDVLEQARRVRPPHHARSALRRRRADVVRRQPGIERQRRAT
jgi:hypothetical protein